MPAAVARTTGGPVVTRPGQESPREAVTNHAPADRTQAAARSDRHLPVMDSGEGSTRQRCRSVPTTTIHGCNAPIRVVVEAPAHSQLAQGGFCPNPRVPAASAARFRCTNAVSVPNGRENSAADHRCNCPATVAWVTVSRGSQTMPSQPKVGQILAGRFDHCWFQ